MSKNSILNENLSTVNWENELIQGFAMLGESEKELTSEQRFDKMITHFENAYIDSPTDEIKKSVLNLSARVINTIIEAIENIVKNEKGKRAENWMKTWKEYTNIVKALFVVSLSSSNPKLTIKSLNDNIPRVFDSVCNLINIGMDNLNSKDRQLYCYKQMSNIFSKILVDGENFPVYKNRELKRVFTRIKEYILPYVVRNRSILEACHLISYLEKDETVSVYNSASIIINELCYEGKWDDAEVFLNDKFIKKAFEKKLRKDLCKLYKSNRLEKIKDREEEVKTKTTIFGIILGFLTGAGPVGAIVGAIIARRAGTIIVGIIVGYFVSITVGFIVSYFVGVTGMINGSIGVIDSNDKVGIGISIGISIVFGIIAGVITDKIVKKRLLST